MDQVNKYLDNGKLYHYPADGKKANIPRAISNYLAAVEAYNLLHSSVQPNEEDYKMLGLEIRAHLCIAYCANVSSRTDSNIKKAISHYVHTKQCTGSNGSRSTMVAMIDMLTTLLSLSITMKCEQLRHAYGRAARFCANIDETVDCWEDSHQLRQIIVNLLIKTFDDYTRLFGERVSDLIFTDSILVMLRVEGGVDRLIAATKSYDQHTRVIESLDDLIARRLSGKVADLVTYLSALLKIPRSSSSALKSMLLLANRGCAEAIKYLDGMRYCTLYLVTCDETIVDDTTGDWIIAKWRNGSKGRLPIGRLIKMVRLLDAKLKLMHLCSKPSRVIESRICDTSTFEAYETLCAIRRAMDEQYNLPHDLLGLVTSYLPWYKDCKLSADQVKILRLTLSEKRLIREVANLKLVLEYKSARSCSCNRSSSKLL